MFDLSVQCFEIYHSNQSMLKKVWQYCICLYFGGGGGMTSLWASSCQINKGKLSKILFFCRLWCPHDFVHDIHKIKNCFLVPQVSSQVSGKKFLAICVHLKILTKTVNIRNQRSDIFATTFSSLSKNLDHEYLKQSTSSNNTPTCWKLSNTTKGFMPGTSSWFPFDHLIVSFCLKW